jgi:hypothetical protein
MNHALNVNASFDAGGQAPDAFLLEGAGPLARLTPKRVKPLFLAAIVAKDNAEIEALLSAVPQIASWAALGSDFDPVGSAISNGDADGLSLLLAAGCPCDQAPPTPEAFDHFDACARLWANPDDDRRKMQALMRTPLRERINERSKAPNDPPLTEREALNKLPARLFFCLGGHRNLAAPAVARAMLEAGADPMVQDLTGRSPMDMALRKLGRHDYEHRTRAGHSANVRESLADILGLLLEFGASRDKVWEGRSLPLALLRFVDPTHSAEALKAVAPYFTRDLSWLGPWGAAACRDPQTSPEVFEILRSLGWSPTACAPDQSYSFWSLFLVYALSGDAALENCALLLDAGADVDHAPKRGEEGPRALLQRALFLGAEALAVLAFSRGADLTAVMARPRKSAPPRIRSELRKRVAAAFETDEAFARVEALLAAEWDRRELVATTPASLPMDREPGAQGSSRGRL